MFASFKVFVGVCEPQDERSVKLAVDGDEVAGVVAEKGVVRATGLPYEIEFVQWLTIRDGKIVRWKSYTDPSSILRAIHGGNEAGLPGSDVRTSKTYEHITAWLSAMKRGDGAAVMAGLADDVEFVTPEEQDDRIIPYVGTKVGKDEVAAAFALALRQPVGTSLAIGSGLAQIGEFSFILGSLGRTLGLLPEEAYQLIIAGAIISIAVNPVVFRMTEMIGRDRRVVPAPTELVPVAFAVILVWEQFEDAREIAEQEANEIGDVYHLAIGLSEPGRTQIQQAALEYANVVIHQEWPMMAARKESPTAWRTLGLIWSPIWQFTPSNPREEAIYNEILQRMDDLNDSRRMRLLAARARVPMLIWGVLIGGGVVTVLFTYFFGLKNQRAQVAMTVLYVASIGFVLFLVAAIDHPYAGAVSIGSEALELVLSRIEHIENAGR